MSGNVTTLKPARYTWGADEFLSVEVSEEMSLFANFTVMSMARALEADRPPGVLDICPANASLLIRFDPDLLAPSDLEKQVRSIEHEVAGQSHPSLETRVLEVPVWYDDPYTAEVQARFREGHHQAPEGSDLDYAARVNGLPDAASFIERHSSQPWIASMVGFVAGLPFLYQLTDHDLQLQVPKYLVPRTDTPKLTIGHGGCFGCIYSVRGAGGYQMFGIAAAPIYDPTRSLPDFAEEMVLFRPGDIVKFTPVDEAGYRALTGEVEAGTFRYRQAPVTFELEPAMADRLGYNRTLLEALDA